MYTEGSVILFNAIPQAVDIFLNDAFLTRMKPAKADHNYAPYPPVTVDRIASDKPIGRAVFGDTNLLEVSISRYSQARYQIARLENIPIEDDLTLTIFEESVILAHHGAVVNGAVEKTDE